MALEVDGWGGVDGVERALVSRGRVVVRSCGRSAVCAIVDGFVFKYRDTYDATDATGATDATDALRGANGASLFLSCPATGLRPTQ